jgi:prepilin-type N-terminal cleavage/methylation domain-containing protein
LSLRSLRKKGFSLTEIVIAIALLGMVIAIVCGVFVKGLEAIKKGKYRSAGLHVADKKFTEFNNYDLADPNGIIITEPNQYIKGVTSASSSSIPWNSLLGTVDCVIYGTEDMVGINYNFSIKVEGYQNNIKKVSVTVTWPEIDGTKTVQLSKLVSRQQY